MHHTACCVLNIAPPTTDCSALCNHSAPLHAQRCYPWVGQIHLYTYKWKLVFVAVQDVPFEVLPVDELLLVQNKVRTSRSNACFPDQVATLLNLMPEENERANSLPIKKQRMLSNLQVDGLVAAAAQERLPVANSVGGIALWLFSNILLW